MKNCKWQFIMFFLLGGFAAFAFNNDLKNVKTVPDSRQEYSIVVDDNGVMRRSDTGEEVSYFGTNYTVPFAHAFRALDYLGVDHKETIKNDVSDMVRLGFNGFRIHLWDVELSDSTGNLLNNKHLDLLDFMIAELENRNIDIILTAQTNFGNGYPEKDFDTGAYTYDFPKCGIHENPDAQKIQENYLKQLMRHINPYTGRSYADDKAIIAVEINNEPCHSGTADEVTSYINRMNDALRAAGFDRMVLYNVSHNDAVREGYYKADIQGTTYQWYPSGLVAGHERKGNFLPSVAEYLIPWKDSMKNYDKLAKVVYEFDPGDILGSYLYPAIVRSFRKEGFQWITQFTYDPTPLAPYNTEYQTHYLNLAYTPSKGISMLIAGEAAKNIPRNSDYGTYPQNNRFGDFRVDYHKDLSILNSPKKYYHSNSTDEAPVNVDSLTSIAGCGSSPIVKYNGTGAYFLDKINDADVWRLEIKPDVFLTDDPFKKHDLYKEIGVIAHNHNKMGINIPGLNDNFYFKAINSGNNLFGKADKNTIDVLPGVYLLASDLDELNEIDLNSKIGNIAMREYHAPANSIEKVTPKFNFPAMSRIGKPVTVNVDIVSATQPDSVIIYPSDISFWRKDNNLIKMHDQGDGKYSAIVSENKDKEIEFKIVIFKYNKAVTYPGEIIGTPLDWDFPDSDCFVIKTIKEGEPVFMFYPTDKDRHFDFSTVSGIGYLRDVTVINVKPDNPAHLKIKVKGEEGSKSIWRTYIGDIIQILPDAREYQIINFNIASCNQNFDNLTFSLINDDGKTYSISYKEAKNRGYVKVLDNNIHRVTIPLNEFKPSVTYIVPEPYPSFMQRAINVDSNENLTAESLEFVELQIDNNDSELDVSIYSIWPSTNK